MADTHPIPRSPRGQLVLRTIAMPADTNAAGDIFGGWLMSQMDMGGAILAHQIARCRVTTVAVNAMEFHLPVLVGDTIACFAELQRVGHTSMSIHIEVWVQRYAQYIEQCVTEAVYTYVALDAAGRPHPVYREGNPPPLDPGP
jgi:acyl-CoA thioesterase YciA